MPADEGPIQIGYVGRGPRKRKPGTPRNDEDDYGSSYMDLRIMMERELDPRWSEEYLTTHRSPKPPPPPARPEPRRKGWASRKRRRTKLLGKILVVGVLALLGFRWLG